MIPSVNTETRQSQVDEPKLPMRKRRAPGILALLPDTLPYYPYHQDVANLGEKLIQGRRRRSLARQNERRNEDYTVHVQNEWVYEASLIFPREISSRGGVAGGEFTLFLFVDFTNRQSLLAVPIISKWFHHALNYNEHYAGNKIICIPNHPATSTDEILPYLRHTGFFHLPFHHSSRLPLLHMLNATRVPSMIVLRNDSGRIVTQYGWEAIEREVGSKGTLDDWLTTIRLRTEEYKKFDQNCDGDEGIESDVFESRVVDAWRNGKTGLPLWWHFLSWIV
mmetsp:Transcript_42/g.112  ORF Transcript_42/g.112 Transcript_42/m.112 type:complete len:279 (+) Transcript_42:112-948(+)